MLKLRQSIVFSIVLHVTIIIAVFTVTVSGRDAVYRVPADYIIVSLFKEIRGSVTTPSPRPALSQEIASTDFVSLRMTDKGTLLRNDNNLPDEPIMPPLSPPFTSPLSKGGHRGVKEEQEGFLSENAGLSLAETVQKGNNISILRAIRNAIEKVKSYPVLARNKGIEGTVITVFTINSKGYPKDIKIKKSSGSEILDSAALKIVTKAAPFPEVNGEIVVPITFKLTGSTPSR